MTEHSIQVLLVEDNEGDKTLFTEYLAEQSDTDAMVGLRPLDVTWSKTLAEALRAVQEKSYDVIALDLGLPDSAASQTLTAITIQFRQVPVVVLSGMGDERIAQSAIRAGAQDYLDKNRADGYTISRALHYAVERKSLSVALAQAQEAESSRQELAQMHEIDSRAATQHTAGSFGLRPMSEAMPEQFALLVKRYAQILDEALERRVFGGRSGISEALRDLADVMGSSRCGPRDVVEVHTRALLGLVANCPVLRAQAYREEGRLAVLEFMGHLASFYRTYYTGSQSVRRES